MPIGHSLCPDCQRLARLRTWYDERGIIEIDIKCECGYHYSWAYGKETIEYGKDGVGE